MPNNDLTKLPRLFLLRHGDTDWTDSHQHTGRTDLPLNSNEEEAKVRRFYQMAFGDLD